MCFTFSFCAICTFLLTVFCDLFPIKRYLYPSPSHLPPLRPNPRQRKSSLSLISIHRRQLFRLIRRDTSVDDLLDIPVHDLVQLVERQIDAVVCHTPLREIVGADLLGAVSGSDLAAALRGLRVLLLLQLQVIEFRAQKRKCLFLILKLRLLGLAVDDDAGGIMGPWYSRTARRFRRHASRRYGYPSHRSGCPHLPPQA